MADDTTEGRELTGTITKMRDDETDPDRIIVEVVYAGEHGKLNIPRSLRGTFNVGGTIHLWLSSQGTLHRSR